MDKNLLKNYAELAVRAGVNIQPGQTLIIDSPIEARELARLCAESAYDAGAALVEVRYSDEKISRIKMERTSLDVLCDVKPWVQNSYLEYIRSEGGAAILSITGGNPRIYSGIDPDKVSSALYARGKAMARYTNYTHKSRIQWCIIAYPQEAWAKMVFPDLDGDRAVEKLAATIFRVSRAEGDAVENWRRHARRREVRRDMLNSLDLSRLHFTAGNGTDLVVGLANRRIWEGVSEPSEKGYEFIPNIPTEELFTAPHREKVNGVVYTSKPYVYNGSLIEGARFVFENGEVKEYRAKKGADLLRNLLDLSRGARRLGEVALVSSQSPVNKEGILFYNTLFDENAACHIALGSGYPGTIKNGNKLSPRQLYDRGLNSAICHEDLMIGTPDMNVTGIKKDGSEINIFENGDWAF